MSTSIHELSCSIDVRLNEVGLLLEKAEEYKDNEAFYGALCRSSAVLLVAHLEGFIKEAAKALIDDMNSYSNFNELPQAIKRTYCTLFIPGDDTGNSDKKIKKLIEVFDTLETKLKVDSFLFENNKNPSPTIIDKVCKNFGVKNIFSLLHNSRLDDVFSENKSETNELLNELKEHVISSVKNYPYNSDPTLFNISSDSALNKRSRSLWQVFLDDLLMNRHTIAHGTSFLNTLSSEEIQVQKTKVEVLHYAIILVLTQCLKM
ncbi:MAE_28990/MAE_18760 family HEPN-like nuclease [Paenibacillus paridis]|uniref:MAE_28990/MAE_18760 family HEPN-like nuclease n=1 Tax=Paenibacillus paridis TaxID=2583376 RepID=UPI00111E9197|nr:MAE_28990/MAE_18760 family HEPN-like nuclease [Paenibacillus paridis]